MRLEAAAAGHVHGEGGDFLGDAGSVGDLTGHVGAASGLAGAAEDDLVDVVGGQGRSAQGLRDALSAERPWG